MKKKITLLLLLLGQVIVSQNIDNIIQQYHNEDIVGLNLTEKLNIDLKHGKIDIKKEVFKKNLYVSDDRKSNTKTGIYFDNFHKITKINAYTDNTHNSLKKTYGYKNSIWKVDNFKEKNILSKGIFFGDQKQKTFTFPAVTKKSITNLNYSVKIKDPHFIQPFYLSNNFPIENVLFSVTFHKDIKIAYKTFNLDSTNVKFSKQEHGNKLTYTWKFEKLSKATFNYDFSPTYYLPQIIIYIKSYNINGNEKNILAKVDDLYYWYQSLIADINNDNQNKLKDITEELIKDVKTDEEKVKSIYYYVQEKINYIAFEDGLNGFIPRDASSVLDKKYGDCKDMANLLNEMLNHAKIQSYLTWIGTRAKPYSYYEVPTTYTDNHMITSVKLNNKFYFLDPTAEYLPFKYPSPFIQGKEALIGISPNQFKIIKVPEVSQNNNSTTIISNLSLNNEKGIKLNGNHNVSLTGYKKLDFNHSLEKKSERDKDFIRNQFKLGNRKTIFFDEKVSNTSLSNDSIKVQFKSNLTEFAREIDKKIYLKLNLDTHLSDALIKGKRKNYAKKIEYKETIKLITTINIPNNFSIEFIPKNVSFQNDHFSFSLNYFLNNDKITLIKNIYIKTLKIPTKNIKNWNLFVKKLLRTNKSSVIIKQKL